MVVTLKSTSIAFNFYQPFHVFTFSRFLLTVWEENKRVYIWTLCLCSSSHIHTHAHTCGQTNAYLFTLAWLNVEWEVDWGPTNSWDLGGFFSPRQTPSRSNQEKNEGNKFFSPRMVSFYLKIPFHVNEQPTIDTSIYSDLD